MHSDLLFDKNYTRCPRKIPLTVTPYFEALTTITVGILAFPVSPDLYNSVYTLPICFNDLMNKWQ